MLGACQGPTLLAAAGYNYSAIDHVEPRADGVNLWAALLDPKETRGPRDHVLLNVDQTNQVTQKEACIFVCQRH